MHKVLLVLFLLLQSPLFLFAQVAGIGVNRDDVGQRKEIAKAQNWGIAYYNVDKLYDTIPSRFYDDRDYTPQGKLRWNSERYNQKIRNIVQLLDSMQMPLVMLYGVENEQVVRDIVQTSKSDYAYIHRTMDYTEGQDFALLYYGERFFPERVTTWNRAMCVEGFVGEERIAIIGNNRSTSIGVLLNELQKGGEDIKIVLLGTPNKPNFEKFGLLDHLLSYERSGQGNRVLRGRWEMNDKIYSNFGESAHCGVYIKRWLLSDEAEPKATFKGATYYGGYSNYLPVYIYFGNLFAH